MSGSLNQVNLIGRLGRDPETRTTPSGVKCCNFSLATDEGYKDKTTGQRVDKTEWHKVVTWRALAEICEKYLHKGSLVFVSGKLATRSWDDQNGQKRYTTEIVANEMQILSPKGNSDPGPQDPQPSNNSTSPGLHPEDDLPF